jgi:hypothetical protein
MLCDNAMKPPPNAPRTARHLHQIGLVLGCAFVAALLLNSLQLAAHAWPAALTINEGHRWTLAWAILLCGLGACAALATASWIRERQPRPLRAAGGPDWRRAAALAISLVAVQAVFSIGHLATHDLEPERYGITRALFWLGGEWRPPAIFASLQLLLAAALALRCWKLQREWVWALAAVVCAYLAADELFSVHESVGRALRASGWIALEGGRTVAIGPLSVYPWTLVFGPLALFVGGAFVAGFVRLLPRRAFALLVVAALVFLAGAIGFETRQSMAVAAGLEDAERMWNVLIEETLEALGVTLAVFVFAWRRDQLAQGARARRAGVARA